MKAEIAIMQKRGQLTIPKSIRNALKLEEDAQLEVTIQIHSLVSTDGDRDYARKRVLELIKIMDMTETSEEEILRRPKPAERYYDDWVNDTWDRNKYIQGGLFYTNKRMLEHLGNEHDYYIQWKMKTIKIRNKPYEAARKRFEKFGEKKADQHTWQAYQKHRNEKLAEEREDKLKELKLLLKSNPKMKIKDIAEKMGVIVIP